MSPVPLLPGGQTFRQGPRLSPRAVKVPQLPVHQRRGNCFACGQIHHHQLQSCQARQNTQQGNTERRQASLVKGKPAGMHLTLRRNSQVPARNMPRSRAGVCTEHCACRWGHTQETHVCHERHLGRHHPAWWSLSTEAPCPREHGQPTRRIAAVGAKRSATALSNSSTAGKKQLL